MLILGHPHIPHEKLYHVNSVEAIKHTPSNCTLLFDYNEEVFELVNHARENALEFAMQVPTLKDAIISENLDAKYLIVLPELSSTVQKAADTYIFDAKVLVKVKDDSSIEALASHGIDGLICPEAIIKVS